MELKRKLNEQKETEREKKDSQEWTSGIVVCMNCNNNKNMKLYAKGLQVYLFSMLTRCSRHLPSHTHPILATTAPQQWNGTENIKIPEQNREKFKVGKHVAMCVIRNINGRTLVLWLWVSEHIFRLHSLFYLFLFFRFILDSFLLLFLIWFVLPLLAVLFCLFELMPVCQLPKCYYSSSISFLHFLNSLCWWWCCHC